jgi:hypothetical protein
MKSVPFALLTLVLSPTLTAHASEQIVPAGSLISCTVSETKLSSKTEAVGDPVLCQVGMTLRNGPSRLPFNSYLEGRFEDYKDPGHFVGKGWMELKFDRMIIEPQTVIPISARVVDAPGYVVDQQGRILGRGHRTRDIVEWSIPILWPIDLLNLPRRGPRPTLKTETRLTLKVMDDTEVPIMGEPDRDPSGLIRRDQSGYSNIPENPVDRYRPQNQAFGPREPEPQQQAYDSPPAYQQPPAYQPPPQAYAPPPMPIYMPVVPVYAAPMYVYAPPPPPVYLITPPPPVMAMYSPPRTIVYPNTIAYRTPYGY